VLAHGLTFLANRLRKLPGQAGKNVSGSLRSQFANVEAFRRGLSQSYSTDQGQ
jgi:hypothetical protein